MQCSPVELDADPTPDLPRDLGNLPPKEAANSCSSMRHQPMSDVRGWRQETHIRLKADDSGSKVLFQAYGFFKTVPIQGDAGQDILVSHRQDRAQIAQWKSPDCYTDERISIQPAQGRADDHFLHKKLTPNKVPAVVDLC